MKALLIALTICSAGCGLFYQPVPVTSVEPLIEYCPAEPMQLHAKASDFAALDKAFKVRFHAWLIDTERYITELELLCTKIEEIEHGY